MSAMKVFLFKLFLSFTNGVQAYFTVHRLISTKWISFDFFSDKAGGKLKLNNLFAAGLQEQIPNIHVCKHVCGLMGSKTAADIVKLRSKQIIYLHNCRVFRRFRDWTRFRFRRGGNRQAQKQHEPQHFHHL